RSFFRSLGRGGIPRSPAESLRKHVERFHFTTAGHITISAGVAEMDQSHDRKWFYKAVDDALYAAKAAGRNCVRLSTPD
ncbi:MAG: diguanylate cyclase, partial [Lachnospiraceae bacterium]|nr:diguanylate cyclase [Lachnospiraceae bacterium]